MVTVIFPAAGQGHRMQAGINKVFLELMGKPILVRTLLTFSQCPLVDGLVVVVVPEEMEFIKRMLKMVTGLKPYKVVAGGSERQYSIYNGLSYVDPKTDIILVHDAARPLVSQTVIKAVINEAVASGAAIAAVPEKNTVKIVSQDHVVKKTPDRTSVWAVQTPQGFQRDIIIRAYQKAQEDGFLGTDDASLVERMGIPVKVVESEYRNIKVTTPEDLIIAEAFLRDGKLSKVKDGVAVVSDVIINMKEHLFRH
jgi:2-C-methyl-D-erythritol 4-phosphate cytidylyltransferase